ncbi:MAG: glycosyltransferase [Thermodesulfovibrionia bacterium]|nr:glycosyltransferase [Thermodesulfovibrionia bacterium]
MNESPELSIIIASYNSGSSIRRCLESLRRQDTEAGFEVIVVDSSTDGAASIVENNFPEVRLFTFAERKFCGDARNFGISVARSEIAAFIDADCTAERDWVESIIKAHRSPYPAIGGAIANGDLGSYVGWAGYFCEFSQWMPHTAAGWMADVAGAGMSYKRKVFEDLGCFIEGTYSSDTELHWRLAQSGHLIRFEPSIRISHYCIDNLSDLIRHEFFHGMNFAVVRVKAQDFSKLKRLVYSALFFLIPVRLFLRIGLSNLRNRIYLVQFIKSSPLLLLNLFSWSLGECVGYIKGV